MLTVRDVMEAPVTVPPGAPLSKVTATLHQAGGTCMVVDSGGRLLGVVRAAQVVDALARGLGTTTAREMMEPALAQLEAADGILDSLERLGGVGEGRVPVVEGGVLCGQVAPASLIQVVQSEWRAYGEELEGLLAQRTAELARARRVGEALLSMAVDEFRRPVRAVLRAIEDLRRLGPGADRRMQAEILDLTIEQARSALSVAADLLEIGRLEAGRLRLVCRAAPVRTLVRDAFQSLSACAGARGVRLSLQGGELLGYYDAELMLRTLVRLLAVLVEACPKGSTIGVGVGPCGPDGSGRESWIRVRVSSALSGADGYRTGLALLAGSGGAETGQAERLGIAFCRKVIEAHGGTLWLDAPAKPGESVAIAFLLPAAECTFARRAPRGLVH